MGDAIATGESLKDRYRLERLLGRGGMAMVWLGHDEVLERPVAVKVLSEAMVGDPDFVARFRREARLAASLSHANLVDVFDFSEEGERPYLVMQFVPGDDLAAHVRRGEPVDCERLARELLDAVAHIHAAGIVHRDIKPQNILLEPDGTAKLLDFGIAQPHDATALTQAGLVLATKRYAAPEVMAGQPASERSDLYSCGVVLRYCRGEAPSASDSLVDWLTHPDPAARPASARQALALLERRTTSAAEPTQAFQPTRAFRPFDSREPAHRRARARPGWGAVGALVAIAAAAAFAVVLGTDGGGGQGAKQGAHAAVRGGGGDGTQAGRSRPEARQVASTVPRPAGEDPSLGSALNEEGFALIQAGRYAAAVPVLEEAVRAFPPQTDDIDYAYALFNLGDALRRSGRPEAAIPVLERRLEIPDQTDVVQRELDAARAEAG